MGDPDHHRVERAHVVGAVAVGAELLGADRGLVAGIEEQHDPLPAVLGEPEGPVRALEREVRGGIADVRCGGHVVRGYGSRGSVDRTARRRHRRPRRARARGARGDLDAAAATSTAPRRRPRSSRRWRPTRRRSSACRAPRPITPPTCVVRLTGSGSRRLLLLGHLDTVVAHDEHRPLTREGERLLGSGTIDMKGGDVLALGVLRALATRAERLRRGRAAARVRRGVARRALRPRPALRRLRRLPVLRGRPAGRRRPRGRRRPPQGGRHAERDRARAQRALGLGARQGRSTRCWPWPRRRRPSPAARTRTGPQRLTAVPTVLARRRRLQRRSRHAAELVCDLRADSLDAFDGVLQALPAELGGARLEAELVRQWPGMDAREATAPLLAARPGALGRPVIGARPRRRQRRDPLRGHDPASPSTASGRAAAARTRRTSTCWPRRCSRARRSRWPSPTLRCVLVDGQVGRGCGEAPIKEPTIRRTIR